jgi:hypothetical protein
MTWGIFKSDSVSEAYKKMKAEELKGKQHKLDVDKDGKIEGEDLAKLRKEETVDEAMQKADVPAYLRKEKGDKPLTVADVKGPRKDSISDKENLAKARNEEVEQIDEISLDTMKSAKEKLGNKAFQAHMDDNKYAAQHYAGRAMDMKKKIAQKERQVTKEEVEQLDELSPGALKAYVNKAKPEVKNAKAERQSARDSGDGKGANDAYQLAKKRTAGIKQAKAKLNKEGLDLFSEREIDMLISEVLKASDDAGKWISDFTKSDDPRFSGDSEEQRKKRALAAYYAAQKKESVDYDSFLEEAAQTDIVKMGAKTIKHANIKDKDDETDVMQPNSEGEADFLDKHTVQVTDDPAGEYKSGADKLAVSSKPTGNGAGKYDGKNKTGIKESSSEDESGEETIAEKATCKEEDDCSYDQEDKSRTGKKTYSTFKEKMNPKKGC